MCYLRVPGVLGVMLKISYCACIWKDVTKSMIVYTC